MAPFSVELCLQICECLDQPSMCALARTAKPWCALVQRILYRNVLLEVRNDHRDRLQKLLHTVEATPKLVSSTRSLLVRGCACTLTRSSFCCDHWMRPQADMAALRSMLDAMPAVQDIHFANVIFPQHPALAEVLSDRVWRSITLVNPDMLATYFRVDGATVHLATPTFEISPWQESRHIVSLLVRCVNLRTFVAENLELTCLPALCDALSKSRHSLETVCLGFCIDDNGASPPAESCY